MSMAIVMSSHLILEVYQFDCYQHASFLSLLMNLTFSQLATAVFQCTSSFPVKLAAVQLGTIKETVHIWLLYAQDWVIVQWMLTMQTIYVYDLHNSVDHIR